MSRTDVYLNFGIGNPAPVVVDFPSVVEPTPKIICPARVVCANIKGDRNMTYILSSALEVDIIACNLGRTKS